jgi:hypothetical protein
VLLAASLAAAPGCVRRAISVRSDPEGAKVFLDGSFAGETPCEIAFTFYGTREIVVRAAGRTPQAVLLEIDPPWWQVLPLDLVTELLIPWTISDERRLFVALAAAPPVSVEDVRLRAERARAGAR